MELEEPSSVPVAVGSHFIEGELRLKEPEATLHILLSGRREPLEPLLRVGGASGLSGPVLLLHRGREGDWILLVLASSPGAGPMTHGLALSWAGTQAALWKPCSFRG